MKSGPKIKESKICPVCGVDKPRTDYYKKLNSISHKCKDCTKVDLNSRSHRYIGRYSEYQNDWRRKKYATEAEYREKISEQKKALYQVKKDELNQKRRDRWANDPKCPARKYYRRKDVKNRTPKWVDLNEILEFYANCPKGKHIDHIIPLKGFIDGRPVTGLHVLWNLQYLTPAENLKKRNRITETYLSKYVKR